MTGSRNYRDLIVWQKSMDLAEKIYSFTQSFPKEERFGITSQMRRAGTSIPANIAEGQARNHTAEFRHFLGIAKGSLAELETWIMLCERLGYLDSLHSKNLLANCEEIQKLLGGLLKSLRP
ncbi:MAG: four helix bundle protein [Proteobacteria bacterium]|nr:four helix bundle protein [Pseudomonadota bacterium]